MTGRGLVLCLLLAPALALPAETRKALVVSAEGRVFRKGTDGFASVPAGSTGHVTALSVGESLLTGTDGRAELQVPWGGEIFISPDSALEYSLTGTAMDSAPSASLRAGGARFRTVDGSSLLVRTTGTGIAAGEAEFAVYAGREGSVLVRVLSGSVTVTVASRRTVLGAGEGLSAAAGGEPVSLTATPEYETWMADRTDAFLRDPERTVEGVASLMAASLVAFDGSRASAASAAATWNSAVSAYRDVLATGDREAVLDFQKAELFPAQDALEKLSGEMRTAARNALAIRRYVVSNLVMELRSRQPVDPSGSVLKALARLGEIAAEYGEKVGGELEESGY